MKKVLKVVLFVFLGFIALFIVAGLFGLKGVKEARELDINSVDLSQVDDGVYTGAYENGRFSCKVEATVKDHEITDVKLINYGNDGQQAVVNEVLDTVVSSQKVDIDTVSGATATTNSVLKAVENAFN
ncbi:MAG: FMN-binding protein [Clostridia bacterium]|nr:FMN-binding protein [Clostridia bacterium]